MTKEKIGRHASNVIVTTKNRDSFLLSRYDDGYPVKKMFRGWANLTGGANSKKDSIYISPEELLRREVGEEYSTSQAMYEKDMIHLEESSPTGAVKPNRAFASREDIESIRGSILENLVPYCDFIVRIPGENFRQGKNKEQYKNIFSVFESVIPEEAMALAKRNLDSGKGLVNEGLVHLATTDELMDGFPLLAWATSPILSHYTDLNFPNLINATEVEIGMPRGSFESYFEDFSYEPGFFKDEK